MRRHKGWLYRFVRRYVLDAEEAYDVLQESFASAWGALSRYDPERPFEVWLRRIALNKCRDRARKAAVRRALFGFAGAPEARPEVADPGRGPDSAAASRQALSRLEAAVAALPRGLKEPLVLTALEGLSHKEAGEVLGLNAKAVETRVYRARKQLAAMLERSDLDDLADAS
jgi:RNA polymerase sigma-70 factor (ECF subfamily)